MVFDFDSALKSGFQKGEIVDFLRQQAKSDINWQEIDELKAQAKANNPNLNENAFVFDYLQNGNFNFNSAPASREDTLALIKEQEKQYQNPNLLERGLESISEAALNLTFGLTPTYESQATQKNQKITDEIYKTAVLNGIDAKDLSQKTNYEIAEQKGGFFDNFRINNTNTSNELIKQERLKQSALNKDFADLNPQEKQAFKSDLNVGARAWDYFFGEEEKQFEDWKENKKAQNLIIDYQSAIDDINRLNTYHQNTSLYNTFFGKDSKLKEQYLKDVNNIAAKVGFDGAEFKENGELYLLKDEEAYKVNEEFFKNLPTTLDAIKNEIALGMGGAVAGARAGASVGRIGGVVGAIGGGAVGAVAGAVGDVLSNNAKLDRENNTKEIISHAIEAGTLSLAGDAIALGLAKGGKPLLKKAKNVISKASDNIILAGFVRNLPTQNLRAAQKILNNSYTKEEKEALFAFGEEFGGRLKSGETSNTQKLIDFTQDSNLPLKSTALKMLNAINKPTLRQRQLELIELIRADESGSSLAFLTEVANTSPKASKVLGDILNATTYNLQKQLKEIGMDNIEIRQIYENLKNKTKADYNDVMENVLGKIYDSNYKTTLDNKNYLNFRKELENSGILESDAMAFLKDIEANIYNPNGVEFKQLNNALKRLNAYTKSANPNLNEHLKSAVRGFLKEDIKKGIDEIFAQNTQGYADAKRLFESALSDYATMKEIFKVKGIKSLMDSTKTKEAAEESFVKYLQGQGETNKSNYEILTQNLPKEQKENLELGVINQIFNKSLSNGDNGLNVFNSVAFNKEIEGLKDKFTTKGAKDALELIGGFHKLFLNDGEIAYALRPAKTGSKGMSSTIATSIKGATEQKTTSAIMDLLMRNLPELGIPFTPIKFRAFNERIQGAALRYHLLSALNHSVNVEDFKSILQRRNTPNNFNLPTREFLNEFLKQVDEIKTETLKDAENFRTREAESFEKQKMEAQFSTTNLSKEQIPNNLQDVRFRDTKVKETENDTITRNNHTDNTNNSNISNTNTLDSHLHTTPQGNERVMGDISTQSRVHREGRLRESTQLQDISFKDTKGKDHILTKETQEQWLKTFGLENLEQSYIPKHSEEIKQALGGKEIRLQKGSLLKLVSQGREEFIPQIKAVLDEPDLIIKEPSEEILLAKHLKNEDYFVNVSFDNGEYLVSISNGIKETRNLQNKLNAGAKIIYQSPNANSISQTLLQTSQYSANKIDNVDSTTNLSKSEVSSATLSPFARAEAEKQARLEIQAKEEAQRELQREARREEIKENQRILQEQKDKESGQSSLNREVDLGDNIKVREIKAPTTSVTLGNNEVLELKYVVVKQEDLKTNFNGNALQPRTQNNPAMIERIATQFKPNLVIGRGGFEDLPILAPDGQVIAGNHRVEGMKQFNQASRKRYEDAIKESFGVELKSDELLLRMPKDELENQKLVSLAFVSNANTNLTYGDKVMASLGKYAKELEMMPRYFGSESVDELSTKVAKSLENNGLLPNEEEANLALLGHLAKNSNGENIASVLTRIYQNNNRENFTKIKDMFVKNAGAFHNLINDTGENGLKNLELRPYLLDSINATSQSLRGTRADNFKKLVEKIENVLKTTDENGSNVILQQDSEYYKNLIGEILGASLAKFARQENPANALYEVLKNAKADLIEELSPTLFKEGKGIEKADIYDFLELLISKGEASEVTSRVIDLLPALKEKEKAFNEYIKNNNLDKRVKEIENGKYSNGNNNNFDTSSSGSDRQKMGADRDIGRRNNGDESTEMGGLRAGEEKQAGDSEATKREVGTRDTATKTRTRSEDTQQERYSTVKAIEKNTLFQQQKEYIIQDEQTVKEFEKYAKKFEAEGDSQGVKDMLETAQYYRQEAQKKREKLAKYQLLERYSPIAEFGTNYLEYIGKGKEAIAKLLETRSGQVAGAFYKEGLGDIDVVWGDSHFGLQHILERRTQDFIKEGLSEAEAKAKAREFVESIPKIIEKGEVRKGNQKAFIDDSEGRAVIALNYYGKDRKWLLTAYNDDVAPSPSLSQQTKHNTDTSKPSRIDGDIKEDSSIKSLTLQDREKAISDVLFKEFENQYTQDSIIDKFIEKKARWQTTEGYYKTPRVFKENKKYIEATKENVLNSKYFKAFERKEQKDFLAQKEQKLQEAQKEAKRIATLQEAIKDITKDKPYSEIKRSLLVTVGDLIVDIEQTLHMKPLAEFGTNYAEYFRDGQGGIAKILAEAKDYEARKEAGKLTEAEIEQGVYKGQVAGAFYKEGLGDIDVVWGEVSGKGKQAQGFGLAKILEKHLDDFKDFAGETKEQKFINGLVEIMDKSQIVKNGDRATLRYEKNGEIFKIGLKGNWKGEPTNNKWIITAYSDEKESIKTINSNTFTKGETLPLNSKTDSTIDKALLSKVQSKFKYDEKKASDLLEWHKDSSPITKDKDGLPKVFYHGSKAGNIKEFKSEFDESGLGFWFVDDIEYAKRVDDNLYEVFLNVKNPIDFRGGDNPNYPYKLQEEMDKLGLSLERYTYQTEKTKEFLQSKGYDALILDGSNKEHPFIAIFDSKQIKHIDNKGSYTDSSGNITSTKPKNAEAEHKYFNEASPNIYQTNPHIGAGLVSGTLAGVESDENGNIIGFDPSKFALGFLGGAVGSKAVSQGFKVIKDNPQLKESLKQELANTLAKGWEATTEQYPILKALEPMKIMQSQKGRIAQAGHILKRIEQKEAKGLYNVTYNGKNASVVYKDLENIDEAILYERGRENPKNKKGYGAKHILKHTTDKQAQGYVTKMEIARLGKDIRDYLKEHKEPFIDSNGARIYEWEKDNVRFRVVVGDIGEDSTTMVESTKTYPTPTERIITFYSDRNLKERMQFKNKALQKSDFIYYKPYERDNLVHSKSEILDLEDTLRYTKEHFDNVESSLRDYHYAHKIAQELLDKRGGGKYNELDSAAKQELMKEAVKIRENRVKQEAPALKEKYAKEIQELESKLQAFKEQNKEAKEQYLKTYQAEIKDYETQEAIRKEQYIQQQEKEREALRKKREQELKEYGVEIDEDYVEDLITNGGYTHQDIQHIKNKAKEGNTIARQILENFDTTHSGNGYNGYSMSNNAIEAYNNGLMPLSKWGKQEADELSDLLGVKVGIAQLKRFLKDYGERGYHHTSRFYNKTPFYSIAEAFQNIDKKELDEYFRKK